VDDYAHGNEQKTMKLKAAEFIRRLLLHVLPIGFVRIRHYGLLANRVSREKLELCRTLAGRHDSPRLAAPQPVSEPEKAFEGKAMPHACPVCGEGRMIVNVTLQAAPRDRGRVPIREPMGSDAS
jgi:Putative transposase